MHVPSLPAGPHPGHDPPEEQAADGLVLFVAQHGDAAAARQGPDGAKDPRGAPAAAGPCARRGVHVRRERPGGCAAHHGVPHAGGAGLLHVDPAVAAHQGGDDPDVHPPEGDEQLHHPRDVDARELLDGLVHQHQQHGGRGDGGAGPLRDQRRQELRAHPHVRLRARDAARAPLRVHRRARPPRVPADVQSRDHDRQLQDRHRGPCLAPLV
mmetsp:Transcript_67508/g.161134  ORF Transcript_67508/g.161134 Transcript_67508/m.161134 type:complete len:211 (+) Transcript_67508:409-1041(+)